MGSTLVNKGELVGYEMLFNLANYTKMTIKKLNAPYFGLCKTGKHEADQTRFKDEQGCRHILLPEINRF